MSSSLLSFYRKSLALAAPALEGFLRFRAWRGKEDRSRAGERRGRASLTRGDAPLVWLHAASVGESLSLLPLLSRILNDFPAAEALVTTGTVTSARLMAERLPPRAFHQYVPVDHPDWVERFLNHWHPDIVLWAESDLWPNMLAALKECETPAILVNARMSERSFHRWRRAPQAAREVLSAFSLCLAQNDRAAERFSALGAPVVRVTGNLKYAAAPLPADAAAVRALENSLGTRPRLLWASTHKGEEDIALRLHQKLRVDMPELLTIILPRHPARGAEVLALAKKAGLAARLRSSGALPEPQDAVYIADTLGETGLFFRLAPLCIMGGSFVPVGGHNPIEPARFGCQIFYGPHMFNFAAICDDFESRGAALRLTDERALHHHARAALVQADIAMGAAAKTWADSQAGVEDEIMQRLRPFLGVLQEEDAA